MAALTAAALLCGVPQMPEGILRAEAKNRESVSENGLANETDQEPDSVDLDRESHGDADDMEAEPEQQELQNSQIQNPQNVEDGMELLHIGQIRTADREFEQDDFGEVIAQAIYMGDAYADDTYAYDQPILLMGTSEVRLFVNREITALPEEDMLIWSILCGESGTAPGTTNLVDEEDDWTEFEKADFAPGFTVREEEDENSIYYKTLLISAAENPPDEDSDYYIRAEYRSVKDAREHVAMTTLPVIMAAQESTDPEEPESETDEESAGSEESKNETDEESVEAETEQVEAADEQTDHMDFETAQDIRANPDNESSAVHKQEETVRADGEKESLTVSGNSVETSTPAEPAGEQDVAGSQRDQVTEGEDAPNSPARIDKLTLNKTRVVLNPGDMLRLSATAVPEVPAHKMIWHSSAPDTAGVDETGLIIALAQGQTRISVECGGQEAYADIEVVLTDAEKNQDQPKDDDGNVIAISDEVWIAGFEKESDALTYSGGRVTQKLRIYHKGRLLKEKTDYVLSYKNNINAAACDSAKAPSVTVTMKGQYSGGRTLYYTIAPKDLGESGVQGYEQVVTYGKKIKIPAPALYDGSRKLAGSKDYVCDYSTLPAGYTKGDSYENGVIYEYTVRGKGNYTGSLTMELAVIRDKNLNFGSAAVSLDQKQYSYRGIPLSKEDVRIHSVKFGKKILDAGLYEYAVYAQSAGTGLVEIYPSQAGREAGYRGMKKLTIKVTGDRSIKTVQMGDAWQEKIIFARNQENGGGICQDKTGVLVYGDDREPLVEGTDYTVKYSGHKKAGTATVTFTGRGRYTGSLKKKYKILPNTNLQITWQDTDADGKPLAVYRKGGAVPRFEVAALLQGEEPCVLKSGTDYSVKVSNNKKTGVMTCTVTGKGNYKGYRSVTMVEVVCADISRGTISLPDKQYSSRKNAWKAAVTIKDVNGKKLAAGTDYDRKLEYRYAGMEDGQPPRAGTIVYVTAVGIRNYAGSSVTGSYRIYNTNIGKLTVVIDPQTYTGREIELSADDIHVYANKNDAKKGQEIGTPCYRIIRYSNNTKAGTAKVVLQGIEGYGGTRTCSFKIHKKKYLTVRVGRVTLDAGTISLGAGNSRQLTASIAPEDAWNKTILWKTSNSKVATVDKEGVVTAIKAGTATITATAQDTGRKATCKVKVSVIPVTDFVLNTEEIRQSQGTRYQLLTRNVQPQGATYATIRWKSTNPEIASVDANGMVSLNKAGMAVIEAYVDQTRIVRKCMVFVDSGKEETAPEGKYLTPQMFRTCDDKDDTKAFNEAVKNLSKDQDTLYVPAGTYYIDACTGIELKSHMKLIMSPDAVLKAIANSSEFYNIIHVQNAGYVTISGGKIVGERYEHGSRAGEWGMGIGIYDSNDITITNVTISDCWGDGIYIGSHHEKILPAGCNQITVKNCTLVNNRRNNMSIVSAKHVTVDRCAFYNAGGTDPEFGIDIEPNNVNNPCEDIMISYSTFEGNGQGSIGIITPSKDIWIHRCTMNGDFINYAGTDVVLSKSVIRGQMNARIGVSLEGGTIINDGGEEEDLLVASFHADEGGHTFGKYGIDSSNAMSCNVIEDNASPSGKALCLRRESQGTREAGFYMNLSDLTGQTAYVLEKGAVYRFEYVVKGTGQWGIKTDQTGWYPCVPMEDKFRTGSVTYKAGSARSCRLILYAVDRTKDMYLEVESIRIYKVR